jgi:hypothetical protein
MKNLSCPMPDQIKTGNRRSAPARSLTIKPLWSRPLNPLHPEQDIPSVRSSNDSGQMLVKVSTQRLMHSKSGVFLPTSYQELTGATRFSDRFFQPSGDVFFKRVQNLRDNPVWSNW